MFSGNILETVSEDLVGELDTDYIFASLDSTGFSSEQQQPCPNGDQKSRLLSSSPSEGHNSDALHSVPHHDLPLTNLNGFCNPSLNLGQVPPNNNAMHSVADGAEGMHALGSQSLNSDSVTTVGLMATDQFNGLTLDSDSLQKPFVQSYSFGNVGEGSEVFSSSAASVSVLEQAKSELLASSFVLPSWKHDLSGGNSQDVVRGAYAPGEAPQTIASTVLTAANNMECEMNPIDTTLMDNETSNFKVRRFTPAKIETKPVCNLDFMDSFQKMDTDGDTLSPLPRPVQIPQCHILQRSFSSSALCHLGNRTYRERPVLLTQQAPLYSSVRKSGSTAAPTQIQLTDVGQTSMKPAFNSMRRVYSTGDIQTLNGMQAAQEEGSPPHSDSTIPDERLFKIGRYTLEERRSRICRYRQKRNERNFSKKIKYACRKTLADSRPRVRGRFAKNEEMEDMLPKQRGLGISEDEDVDMYLQPTRFSEYEWRFKNCMPLGLHAIPPVSMSSRTR